MQTVKTLTSAKGLDDLVSILEVSHGYHDCSLWVKNMCRFVVLQNITIGFKTSLPLCNHLVVVCIDCKTPQSSDQDVRGLNNRAEPLYTLVISCFDVPGIEEPVDEDSSGGRLNVSACQTGDWRCGLRGRFILVPRLFQLVLCGAYVFLSECEDLLNELRW